ncbi:MAG: phosphoenolpyruvate--protein phosphotransferase [Gammaproteobacteria bacterium]|nr:phosphoenolpyruvate--protein phosphotransferase [Gammaproteobacteria bacterium]
MTFSCHGIGISASYSIAIGKVHRLERDQPTIRPRQIRSDETGNEISRFCDAIIRSRSDLLAVREQLPASTASDIVDFINTHLLMMEDQALTQAVEDIIKRDLFSAEWALQLRHNELIKVFDEMEDPYLRTRKDDLDHVVTRIQKHLLQVEDTSTDQNMEGKVIVARDLSPSDTILMRQQGICAFITEYGSPMSHTAILARSLNIPAIVGIKASTKLLHEGETIVVDGLYGIATASPEQRQLDQFKQRLQEERGKEQTLKALSKIPSVSTDGQPFELMANIELPEDIETALKNNATAIGLYRTEFLYMNRQTPPAEEEHFNAYAEIIENLDGLPLTIRTLDLGADKPVDNQHHDNCNPALGMRAIRLCLKETELFKTQLRAIIRASALGPVRLMIPMLTTVREIDQSRKLISDIQQELKVEGIAYDADMPVGGMIEVPSAALDAHNFARKLDFLSIGTNDLIQYTLAIDRVDEELNYLYDPLHPAVIRLIRISIEAAHAYNIPISMCGEMAGDPQLAGLLAGLGLREFSMQPNSLLKTKQALLATDFGQLTIQADKIFRALENGHHESFSDNILKMLH